jgi:hypothetical protein
MALDLQGTWKITADFNLNGKIDDPPPPQKFTFEFGAHQHGNDAYIGAYLYYHGKSIGAPGGVESSYLAQVFSSTTGDMISMIQHNGLYYATYCGYLDPSTGKIKGSWADVRGNSGDFLLEK